MADTAAHLDAHVPEEDEILPVLVAAEFVDAPSRQVAAVDIHLLVIAEKPPAREPEILRSVL